jgi:hypothetical protein
VYPKIRYLVSILNSEKIGSATANNLCRSGAPLRNESIDAICIPVVPV